MLGNMLNQVLKYAQLCEVLMCRRQLTVAPSNSLSQQGLSPLLQLQTLLHLPYHSSVLAYTQQAACLTTSASVNSEQAAASSVSSLSDTLTVESSAAKRLLELQRKHRKENLMLRVEVEGGGCSGFQYKFRLDEEVKADDLVFEKDGTKFVTDKVSFQFLKGAKLEFDSSLIRSSFVVRPWLFNSL